MKRIYFALLALGVLCCACETQKEQRTPEKSGEEITFTSSVGAFLKSTDTGFEDGDAIGVSALDPVNKSNVHLVVKNGVPTPDSPIYWEDGQTDETDFVAYYPYSKNFVPTRDVSFSVATDQSTRSRYCGSDLMGSTITVEPGHTVNLAFKHLLTKLTLRFTGNLAGEVVSVNVSGVPLSAIANIREGSVEPSGISGSIEACPISSGNEKSWILIAAPGKDISPELTVTVSSGETYKFKADAVDFVSGKQLSADLEINASAEHGEAVSFSVTVEDWEYDGSIIFIKEEEDTNSGYYLLSGADEGPVELVAEDNGQWYSCTLSYSGDKTGIIAKGEWGNFEEFYGIEGASELETLIDLNTETRTWFEISNEGPLRVRFNPVTLQLQLTEYASIGIGKMVEDLLASYTDLPRIEYDVEIEQKMNGEALYRVVSPYASNPYKKYLTNSGFHVFTPVLQPAYLYLVATDPDKAYIAESSLDVSLNGVALGTASLVPENDWNSYSSYGVLTDGEFSFPADGCVLYADNRGYYSNRNGSTYIVLPGYARHSAAVSSLSDLSYDGAYTLSDGSKVARFSVTLDMDNTMLHAAMYDGFISDDDTVNSIVESLKAGTADNMLELRDEFQYFLPGMKYVIDLPQDATGKYTAFFYTEGTDGSWWYRYTQFYYVPNGEEAPACDVSITSIENSSANPESEINVTITVKDASGRIPKIAILTSEEAQAIGENNYLSYAEQNGEYTRGNGNFTDGYTVVIGGLEPDTQYTVLVYETNGYGSAGVASATIRTATAAEWTSLGIGKFMDALLCAYSYSSNVEILKAVGVEGKYRVMNPYKEYWDNASDSLKTADYCGFSAEYFDFYTKEYDGTEYVYYSAFCTGIKEADLASEDNPETGVIYYKHGNPAADDPANNVYCYKNKKIADGVYQLAPYGEIKNTNFYYNFMNTDYGVIIILPGYSYNVNSAPRKNVPAASKREFIPSKKSEI